MKTYSDLQDIDQSVNIKINLRPVGLPNISVAANQNLVEYLLKQTLGSMERGLRLLLF